MAARLDRGSRARLPHQPAASAVPALLRFRWSGLGQRLRECMLATAIERALHSRVLAVRAWYDPGKLAAAMAGTALRLLEGGSGAGRRAGAAWVIPQLQWLHEVERVCPFGNGAPDPFAAAPPLEFPLAGVADRPGGADRAAGQRPAPASAFDGTGRGTGCPAWTVLLGEDDQRGFTDDLAAVVIGVSHRGQLRKAAGEMGITGWLETVLCWPRRFIVGFRDEPTGSAGFEDGHSGRIASSAMGKLPMRARAWRPPWAEPRGGCRGVAGRGDGSVIGGVIGLRVEPDLLSLLAADRQIVLVTGTNGKTTTTRLITAALSALGPGGGLERVRREHGGRAGVRARPGARRPVSRCWRWTRSTSRPCSRATSARVVDAAEPQPGPDGPGRRDLAGRAALAGGARGRAGLPGGGQRRRPADRLGGERRQAGHLGGGGPALARGLLVLPAAAARTCGGTSWAGGAASAASAGPRPAGCWTATRSSTRRGQVTELSLALPGRANRANAVVALAVAEVVRRQPGGRRCRGSAR